MQGCIEWRQIGLDPPASVLQSTQKYRDDNNSVGQWIETACFLDPKFRTSMKGLHDSYCSWCDSSSLEPLHSSLFGKELTRLGYKTFKAKKGNGRIGIGLKRPPDVMGNVASKPSRSLPPQLLARSSGSSVRVSCSLQAAWGVCPRSRTQRTSKLGSPSGLTFSAVSSAKQCVPVMATRLPDCAYPSKIKGIL